MSHVRPIVISIFLLIIISSDVTAAIFSQRWNYTVGKTLKESGDVQNIFADDIDKDLYGEVVFVTTGLSGPLAAKRNTVQVLDRNGSLKWKYEIDDVVRSSYIGDINHDDNIEVIVGSGVRQMEIDRGTVHLLDSSGKLLRSFSSTAITRTIHVTDLDNDNYFEIITGSSLNIHVFQIYGEDKWSYYIGFPTNFITSGDIDADGYNEVIVGADKLYIFNKNGVVMGSYDFDPGLNPNLKKVTSVYLARFPGSIPFDIIALSRDKKVVYDVYIDKITASGNTKIITLKERWKFSLDEEISSMILTDINDDGYDEIVLGSLDNNVYLVNSKGYIAWQYRVNGEVRSIHLGDLDNDKKNEIIVGTSYGSVYFLNEKGEFKWKYDGDEGIIDAIAKDLDGDGFGELIVATDNHNVFAYDINNTILQKYIADDLYYAGQRYYISSEYGKAKEYLLKAKDFYLKLGFPEDVQRAQSLISRIESRESEERRRMADVYYDKAYEYFVSMDYEQASIFVKKSKEICIDFGDSDCILRAELLEIQIRNAINPIIVSTSTQTTEIKPPIIKEINIGTIALIIIIVVIVVAIIVFIRRRKKAS